MTPSKMHNALQDIAMELELDKYVYKNMDIQNTYELVNGRRFKRTVVTIVNDIDKRVKDDPSAKVPEVFNPFTDDPNCKSCKKKSKG